MRQWLVLILMLVFSLACFIKAVEAQTFRSPRVKKNKITNKDRYYRPREQKKRTIRRRPQRQVKPRVRQKPKPKVVKPKLKKRKPRRGSFQYHNLRYLWLNEVLGNTGRRDIRRKRTLREKFPKRRK